MPLTLTPDRDQLPGNSSGGFRRPAQEERTASSPSLSIVDRVRLFPALCRLIRREIDLKRHTDLRVHDGAEAPAPTADVSRWQRLMRRGRNLLAFLRRMLDWNGQLLGDCCHKLRLARSHGVQEIVLYGEGHAARMVLDCSRVARLQVTAVCPMGLPDSQTPPGLALWSETALAGWDGPIVVATFANSRRHVDRLLRLGISRDKLIVLE